MELKMSAYVQHLAAREPFHSLLKTFRSLPGQHWSGKSGTPVQRWPVQSSTRERIKKPGRLWSLL